MSVESVQSAAAAEAATFAARIDALSSSMQNVALGLGFSDINNPFDSIELIDYDKSALTSLSTAVGQLANERIDTLQEYGEAPQPVQGSDNYGEAVYRAPSSTPDTSMLPQTPGAAPVKTFGSAPGFTGINEITPSTLTTVAVPNAPSRPTLDFPEISQITLPSLNVSTLPVDETPGGGYLLSKTFDWVEEDYNSAGLTQLQAMLLYDMINGGYGINPADEQPLWERAREREMVAGNTLIEQATSQAAARGMPLPSGALMALIEGAQQATLEKVSSASREIALKRADMYVENRKFTIQQAKEVEQMLITYWGYKQERSMKAAQLVVEMSIGIYNALANVFNTRVQAYKTQIDAYNAQVQAAFAPLERDKAILEAVKSKAGVYSTVVQAFEAEVRGALAVAEVNKARLEQDKLRFDLERGKIEVYKAKIDGFQAEVQAYTAQTQGYSAAWQGYSAGAQAYAARVQAYSAEVDAAVKEFSAQAEVVKLNHEKKKLEYMNKAAENEAFKAKVSAIGAANTGKIEAYKAKIAARGEAIRGYASAAGAMADYYKAASSVAVQMGNAQAQFNIGYGQFMTTKASIMAQSYSGALSGFGSAINGYANAAAGIAAQIENI